MVSFRFVLVLGLSVCFRSKPGLKRVRLRSAARLGFRQKRLIPLDLTYHRLKRRTSPDDGRSTQQEDSGCGCCAAKEAEVEQARQDAGDWLCHPPCPAPCPRLPASRGRRILDSWIQPNPKMMCHKFLLVIVTFVVITLCGARAMAESPHTPPVNSPERKAILDALRPPFERDLNQPIKFYVSFFRVLDTWAFALGTPENARSGKAIKAFPETDPDFCGLLHKNGRGEWIVVDHAAGFGDPFYAQWPKTHGAPLAIFPEIVASMQKSNR